jgi:hypothetical protein
MACVIEGRFFHPKPIISCEHDLSRELGLARFVATDRGQPTANGIGFEGNPSFSFVKKTSDELIRRKRRYEASSGLQQFDNS